MSTEQGSNANKKGGLHQPSILKNTFSDVTQEERLELPSPDTLATRRGISYHSPLLNEYFLQGNMGLFDKAKKAINYLSTGNKDNDWWNYMNSGSTTGSEGASQSGSEIPEGAQEFKDDWSTPRDGSAPDLDVYGIARRYSNNEKVQTQIGRALHTVEAAKSGRGGNRLSDDDKKAAVELLENSGIDVVNVLEAKYLK